MPNIDELSIEIKASANEAKQAITNLTASLQGLSTAVARINTSSINKFAQSVETLSKTGKRVNDVTSAIDKLSSSLAKNFGINSKQGVDALKASLVELADATRKFQESNGDMKLGDNLEAAQRNVEDVIKQFSKTKMVVDDTTRSVKEFVQDVNRGTTKINLSDVAKEFGEDFSGMRKVLGKNFSSNIKQSEKSVQDFAEWLTELNDKTGADFDTHTISNGFKELVDRIRDGKEEELKWSDAVQMGARSTTDLVKSVGDAAQSIDSLVRLNDGLKSNGLDAIAESMSKLSAIELPDFSPFADAINALNKASTEKVVANINAVKGALDGTLPSTEALKESLNEMNGKNTQQLEKNMQELGEDSRELGNSAGELGNVAESLSKLSAENQHIAELVARIKELKQALKDIESGKPANIDYSDAIAELKQLEAELNNIKGNKGIEDLGSGITSFGSSMIAIGEAIELVSKACEKLAAIGEFAFRKIIDGAKLAFSVLRAFGEYIADDFKEHVSGLVSHFKGFSTSVQENLKKLSKFWQRTMKTFTFMLVRKAITAIIDNVKEAIDELALFEKHLGTLSGGQFNNSISEILADFHYIGRAIVAAFEPLINFVVPALNAVASAVANVLSLVGQFFAAFTGQSYFVKAKKTVVDYGDSIDDNTKKLKKQKKLLLSIDEINPLPAKNDDSSSGKSGGVNYKDAFEELPVPQGMIDLANKVKDILEKLFDPLKKAWDIAGKYVIRGFKYMVSELGKLAKSIGRDFLTVWQQDETVQIFANLLRIVGDLEYVVGNLARRFREAWDELTDDNITRGQSILEGIRNIIAVLVEHVRNVTKYMKEWSAKIDFKPLLTGVDELLKKLKTLADFIGGVFEDVMKNVILEHIRFLIEDGLPHLMHAIGEVLNSFDFVQLRKDLEPLEKAFEQMRQSIDIGLVNAMKNVGKAIGEWTQTQNFKDFLASIENIMKKVTPERVEKLFTGLGLGIVEIVKALADFISSEEFQSFIDQVVEWYDSISAEDIANFFKKIGDAIVVLAKDLLEFVQSDAFQNFLKAIADWWNRIDAEDLAKGLENIAKAIITFKFLAFVGPGIAGFFKFLGSLQQYKNFTTIAKGLKDIAAGGSAAGKGVEAAGAGAKAAGASLKTAGAGTAAAGTSLAGVAATAAAATADLVLVAADFDNLKNASQGYSEAQQAHTNEVDTALTNLKHVYETKGADVATEWAKTCYDVDISGQDLLTAQQTLTNKIDEHWEGVPQDMFDGFKQGWNDYFGSDGKGLLALCGDAFNQLITGVENILGIASPSTVFADIGLNIVEGLWNGIKNKWTEFITNVGGKINEFKTSALTGIGQFVTDGVAKFETLKTDAGKKIGEFKDGAVTAFETFRGNVSEKVGNAAEAVKKSAKEIADNVSTKLKEVPKEAKSKFDELKTATNEKFGKVKDAIGKKMGESIEKVSERLGKMKEKFQKFDLSKVASNIIRGFINGLKSAWTGVIKWANEAVSNLKKKFQEALKIQSPSKVFMEYGKYTVEGFNEGISTFQDTTAKTVDKWVASFDDMQVTVTPEVTPTITPTTASIGTVAEKNGITRSDLENILFTFGDHFFNRGSENTTIVLELDGKKIYEDVIRQDRHQMLRTGRSSFAY